jgi:hypothetical protein
MLSESYLCCECGTRIRWDSLNDCAVELDGVLHDHIDYEEED